MSKKIVIVGGGFGGLAVACLLAHDGHSVTVLEKNNQLGGRAGLLQKQGFTFDTGPSWYLMPDVFERFFESLGERVEDHLQLTKLSPSYRVYFKDQNQYVDMTGNLDQDAALFESIEKGAGDKLRTYLRNSQQTYDISVGKFLYKNYNSLLDFFSPELMRSAPKVHLFSNMDRYVGKYFRDQRLQQIMQYPLVFWAPAPTTRRHCIT
jgi:phytoene desaturase